MSLFDSVAAVFRHNFVMLLARPKRLVRVETGGYADRHCRCVKRVGRCGFKASDMLRENLSSVLFSLFLNDLKDFLTSNNVQGLKLPFAFAQDVSSRYQTKKLFVFIFVRG